jgi:hypothetical protein
VFKREDSSDDRKRKKTNNIKCFTAPWRADNFVSHLQGQHATKFNEYSKLSANDKANYFSSLLNAQHPFGNLVANKDAVKSVVYTIDTSIVDNIIKNQLLDLRCDDED